MNFKNFKNFDLQSFVLTCSNFLCVFNVCLRLIFKSIVVPQQIFEDIETIVQILKILNYLSQAMVLLWLNKRFTARELATLTNNKSYEICNVIYRPLWLGVKYRTWQHLQTHWHKKQVFLLFKINLINLLYL